MISGVFSAIIIVSGRDLDAWRDRFRFLSAGCHGSSTTPLPIKPKAAAAYDTRAARQLVDLAVDYQRLARVMAT